jgi:hypothetical protein
MDMNSTNNLIITRQVKTFNFQIEDIGKPFRILYADYCVYGILTEANNVYAHFMVYDRNIANKTHTQEEVYTVDDVCGVDAYVEIERMVDIRRYSKE